MKEKQVQADHMTGALVGPGWAGAFGDGCDVCRHLPAWISSR